MLVIQKNIKFFFFAMKNLTTIIKKVIVIKKRLMSQSFLKTLQLKIFGNIGAINKKINYSCIQT